MEYRHSQEESARGHMKRDKSFACGSFGAIDNRSDFQARWDRLRHILPVGTLPLHVILALGSRAKTMLHTLSHGLTLAFSQLDLRTGQSLCRIDVPSHLYTTYNFLLQNYPRSIRHSLPV